MARKKWCVAEIDKDKASALAQNYNIDPFAALLLVSRDITEEEQIVSFFSGESDFCDPFELPDMEKAVQRIEQAMLNGEKIAIYGDYDADGVTSTAVLYLYLEMIGADVTYYIPDRNTEGYGLNMNAIKTLCDKGVSLIVTVDNGISSYAEAQYIYELGMELVVTDHHKAGDKLPRACAVVDAHRADCNCKFRDWSGVGIAFKLMCALSGGDFEDILDSYSDIIALGTIADVVPLIGENRALVKHGLRKINSGNNQGIESLREKSSAVSKKLSSTSTAFTLVPRINAIGRVDKAEKAFRLLISDSSDETAELSEKIEEANVKRQSLEQQIYKEALAQLEEKPEMRYDRVLVFDGEGWHAGVIGIVAARFVEQFGKPCIVIASDGENARGSARSIEGFSMYDAVSACCSMLTHFGGHTLAAGFSLRSADIESFRKAVNDYAKTVLMPFPKVNIDLRLKPDFITADILPVIEQLEPFGAGNAQPMFGLFKMKLVSVQPIGGGKHLRLSLSRSGSTVTALKFSTTLRDFPYVPGDVLDLAVRLEKNEYMGQTRVSIYIRDIRMSGTDDEKYLVSLRLYEKVKRREKLLLQEAKQALPERNLVAGVFRYIRDNGGFGFESDILCYRLGDDGSNACKVLLSIDVLCELGILKKENSVIIPADTSVKVNLDDSPLMAYLKEAANG